MLMDMINIKHGIIMDFNRYEWCNSSWPCFHFVQVEISEYLVSLTVFRCMINHHCFAFNHHYSLSNHHQATNQSLLCLLGVVPMVINSGLSTHVPLVGPPTYGPHQPHSWSCAGELWQLSTEASEYRRVPPWTEKKFQGASEAIRISSG